MMNNDINFEKNATVFNYRVAVIIRNKEKILVQIDNQLPYYFLAGGRCQLREPSTKAAQREFKEETGLDTILKKEIGMIENFFISNFNGKNYHEILLIHELELVDKNMYNTDIIHCIEEAKKGHVIYQWMDINELKQEDFRPKIILDMLNSNEFIHKINIDETY